MMNTTPDQHELSENEDLFYNDLDHDDEMNTHAIQQILKDGSEHIHVDKEKVRIKRRQREKRKKRRQPEDGRATVQRRIVNLPASQPVIRTIDGEERLCFKYNTKITDTEMTQMPRNDLEENEFCVRFDLDSVDVSKLNEKFKMDNCIYPRANVPHDLYCGNRWEYETDCNKLAWQFVALNPVLLYGKKGLIQRAVDSYRNINKCFRSRKASKQEQDIGGYIERRKNAHQPYTVGVPWTVRGVTKKCRVRIDIDNIDYSKIDDDFKLRYSVFPDYFDHKSFGLEHWETNNPDNILAVKIAHANVNNTHFWNAVKATDKSIMLKSAVNAYKFKIENPDLNEENEDNNQEKIDLSEEINEVLDKTYEDTDEMVEDFSESDSEDVAKEV